MLLATVPEPPECGLSMLHTEATVEAPSLQPIGPVGARSCQRGGVVPHGKHAASRSSTTISHCVVFCDTVVVLTL